MLSSATHVTFLTKEIKLLPEKGKPSESNQCGFGGETGSVSSTRLKYVRGQISTVKAEDREYFDKDRAEFELCVAGDTE